MKWKIYLATGLASLAGLTLLVLVSAFSGKQRASRPNILLIVSEDHGPHLSCYGDDVIKTPNLDGIAASGVRFNNAYVTQSVCSPSRSSILSGLYPHQTGHLGLTTFGFRYAKQVNTIYARLKAAGYRTGMIGKLHVMPESAFPIGYHPLTSPNYERKDMGRYADHAEKFINDGEEPFFLMVNYPDAHWPFIDQIDGLPKKPVTKAEIKPFNYLQYDNKLIREYTTAMYNCLLRLDICVGDLLAKLKTSGKERNTLVIYLSDHGDEMARGKFDIYEVSNKVPFLMSWPGKINPGKVSDALVSSVDIVPTLMDVAGLPADNILPGSSLMKLFGGDNKPTGREYLFTEKNIDQTDLYNPRRAVRDSRYKLIYSLLDSPRNIVAYRYLTAGPKSPLGGSPSLKELHTASAQTKKTYAEWLHPNKIQLYDLKADPWEFNDLSADPRLAPVKKRLMAALVKWQQDTDDPLRFPEKLKMLTEENKSNRITKSLVWRYPQYLYGE